jgi:hypothetical protein
MRSFPPVRSIAIVGLEELSTELRKKLEGSGEWACGVGGVGWKEVGQLDICGLPRGAGLGSLARVHGVIREQVGHGVAGAEGVAERREGELP